MVWLTAGYGFRWGARGETRTETRRQSKSVLRTLKTQRCGRWTGQHHTQFARHTRTHNSHTRCVGLTQALRYFVDHFCSLQTCRLVDLPLHPVLHPHPPLEAL